MLRSLLLFLICFTLINFANGDDDLYQETVSNFELDKNFEYIEGDDLILSEKNGSIQIRIENKNKLMRVIQLLNERSAFSKGGGEGGGD